MRSKPDEWRGAVLSPRGARKFPPDTEIAARPWKSPRSGTMLSTMDEIVQNGPVPQEWIAALEESAADIAAGRTVPASVVLQKMRDTLARMEKCKAVRAVDRVLAGGATAALRVVAALRGTRPDRGSPQPDRSIGAGRGTHRTHTVGRAAGASPLSHSCRLPLCVDQIRQILGGVQPERSVHHRRRLSRVCRHS